MFQAFLALSQSSVFFLHLHVGPWLVPASRRGLHLPCGSSEGDWWEMVLEGLGSPSSGSGPVMVHLVKEVSYHLQAGRVLAAARMSSLGARYRWCWPHLLIQGFWKRTWGRSVLSTCQGLSHLKRALLFVTSITQGREWFPHIMDEETEASVVVFSVKEHRDALSRVWSVCHTLSDSWLFLLFSSFHSFPQCALLPLHLSVSF